MLHRLAEDLLAEWAAQPRADASPLLRGAIQSLLQCLQQDGYVFDGDMKGEGHGIQMITHKYKSACAASSRTSRRCSGWSGR